MQKDKTKILIADDEPDILEFLQYNFNKEGYTTFTATNGVEAVQEAEKHRPDLIILDVMMPELDGMEACRILRKNPSLSHAIILFLTARSEDFSEISGFEAGADDYVTKPIRLRALLARVQSLLNRKKKEEGPSVNEVIERGEIRIFPVKRVVKLGEKAIYLPRKEFELLLFLSSQPERVFTRDEIYNKIWGTEVYVGERTIDVHIRKLRKALGKKYIKTSKGVGYSFSY